MAFFVFFAVFFRHLQVPKNALGPKNTSTGWRWRFSCFFEKKHENRPPAWGGCFDTFCTNVCTTTVLHATHPQPRHRAQHNHNLTNYFLFTRVNKKKYSSHYFFFLTEKKMIADWKICSQRKLSFFCVDTKKWNFDLWFLWNLDFSKKPLFSKKSSKRRKSRIFEKKLARKRKLVFF